MQIYSSTTLESKYRPGNVHDTPPLSDGFMKGSKETTVKTCGMLMINGINNAKPPVRSIKKTFKYSYRFIRCDGLRKCFP